MLQGLLRYNILYLNSPCPAIHAVASHRLPQLIFLAAASSSTVLIERLRLLQRSHQWSTKHTADLNTRGARNGECALIIAAQRLEATVLELLNWFRVEHFCLCFSRRHKLQM